MSEEEIGIAVSAEADIDKYPDHLLGNMDILGNYRNESQWILYLMLKEFMPVRLCTEPPDEGIYIVHKGNVRGFIWKPKLYVVSLQWDYPRDDRAQVHLVSNIEKTKCSALGWMDRCSFAGLQHYVSPIMHMTITPRDAARGDRFENIVYFGELKNLDEDLRTEDFQRKVEELGLKFIVVSDADKMTDYSEVDAIIAVRKFGMVISNKSSVKLINAWRGGVPAVLGCEVGLRETRTNEYDYIEVDSVEDVLNGLRRLKDDHDYRSRVIENARQKAGSYTAEGQRDAWVDYFKTTVIPEYIKWKKRSILCKYTFLCVRWVRYAMRESMSYVWHRILRRRSSSYS